MSSYNKIDMEILQEFTEGEVHDIYLFVKKYCYKDMYMTIHDYALAGLTENESLDRYIRAALYDYKLQNHLNKSLKVTDGKYFDSYLLKCIVGIILDRYGSGEALKNENKKSLTEKIIELENKSLDNRLISEHNVSILTGLLKSKFQNKDNLSIFEVTDFIENLTPTKKETLEVKDFFEYLNNLIKDKNLTLNQLGNESLIKKSIYDISLGKIPTKNQLIMLVLTLKLNTEEKDKLFKLAKFEVKNTSESNIYAFESDNERDELIKHWLDNIDELQNISNKRRKSLVETVNDILKNSDFEILK